MVNPSRSRDNAPQWITPEVVIAARGVLGWSRGELARQSGLTNSVLGAFERGKSCTLAQRMQIVFAFSRAKIRFLRRTQRGRTQLGVQKMTSGGIYCPVSRSETAKRA